MSNPQNKLTPTPLIETILEGIADWVSKYRHKFNNQLAACTPDEVMRVAKDLRLTKDELQELARKGPDSADLLLKMLVALNVDPKSLEKADPQIMQDLQRLCTTCGVKKRCERELAHGTAGERFRDFCPNAFTLDALLNRNEPSPR
jgi:hypothetical protein